MKYIWIAFAVIAIFSAMLNIKLHIDVILRRRMLYDCNYVFTEYLMSVVVIAAILKNAADEATALMVFALAMMGWLLILYFLSGEGRRYARVFGIRPNMHPRLVAKIEKECEKHSLPKRSVYIFGGDKETPCNMIIFKDVDKEKRIAISNSVNSFLRKYSYGFVRRRIAAIVIDVLAIFVVVMILL